MRTLDDLNGKWTRVKDSGGGGIVRIDDFFFQGTEEEAMKYMEDVLGHDPHSVTCDCCGSDFNIDEDDGLMEMLTLELMHWGTVREWHKREMSRRNDDSPILTYADAQAMVLAYMNGKESELTSIKFIFRDEMDKGAKDLT